MTTAVQHRRGTTAEHATFTGLEGEVTIDTTKDTAVIHDGALAGGYPLAKENLANVTPSGLPTIDGASTAADDKFFIYDQSTTTLKSITRAELNNAIEQDALANVAITGGTINGTTIGGTTAAAITGTTITANSGFSGNLTGNVSGNAGTVTNGVYTTGDQTIAGIKTLSSNPILSAGVANGITYLNGSKVLTSGSALTYNGTGLGVGVASALSRLHVSSNTGTSSDFSGSIRVTNESYAAGTYAGVLFETADTLNSYITGIRQGSYAGQLAFGVNTGGSGTSLAEQMRLTSTGLGIGTSSPKVKLQTVGETSGFPTLGTSAGGLFVSSNNGLYGLYSGVNGSTGAAWVQSMRNDSATAFGIVLQPVGGNLGLGVTPSAWGSSWRAFDFNNRGGLACGFDETDLNNNVYRTNTGAYFYKQTAAATTYNQSGGAHTWFTAPSGTAGNAISFTQAMTLDASGNLLVGQTATGYQNSKSSYISTGAYIISHSTANISGDTYIGFGYNGGQIGSISQNGTTGVLYNMVSDHRLKTVIGAVSDAGQRIDALEPIEYEWKSDGSRTRGFLAHKFQEVYAGSVTGSKDAVDKDGKPVYQAMQAGSSEVIADLVAEIQSLRKRLAAAGI